MNENELFNYKEVHPNDHLVRVDKNGKVAYENTFKCLSKYYEVNKPISIVNEINSKDKWIDDYFKKQDENKAAPTNKELTNIFLSELKETDLINDDIFSEMVRRFTKRLKSEDDIKQGF